MKHVRLFNTTAGLSMALAMLFSAGMVGFMVDVPQAQAVATEEQYQQKVQSQADLKAQLAGVDANLANEILKLNDLTQNQIPAAQEALESAQTQADQAASLAQATSERLQAAQKDQADLEEKIKQTGEDYDDAQQAVAQLARNSFHGSNASEVMDVVTNSTTTNDFVGKMQSEAAVTRSEANAANDAANTLNTSKNRKERLNAIENQIADLKAQADSQAASAQQAAQSALEKQTSLQALRDEGTAARENLESQQSSLTTQSAKQAAQIVSMRSQIDSYNQQQAVLAASQNANANSGGGQYTGSPSDSAPAPSQGGGSPASGGSNAGSNSSASGMDYAVPGGCPEGSSYCYGHNTGNTVGGSAYPYKQCTLWAYLRRSALSLPVGSYMGNGGEWAAKGRALGYLVNNTPHFGAAMVFLPGQMVTNWRADYTYGHVAIVEQVLSGDRVLISEGGTGFSTFPTSEIVYNASSYQYVHY
jgi:surface antigen/peptidoglycan hydrolase CwlO-like protein